MAHVMGVHVPARVVDDVLYNSPDVAVALGKVEGTQACGVLVQVGVRLELQRNSIYRIS